LNPSIILSVNLSEKNPCHHTVGDTVGIADGISSSVYTDRIRDEIISVGKNYNVKGPSVIPLVFADFLVKCFSQKTSEEIIAQNQRLFVLLPVALLPLSWSRGMKAMKIRLVLVAMTVAVVMLIATRMIFVTAEVRAMLILGKMSRG
jgi:hypothetical protein